MRAYELPVNEPFNVFPIAFIRNTDPAVTWPDLVGPGMVWFETEEDSPPWGAILSIKVRNAANDDWITASIGGAGGPGSGLDADTLDGLNSTAFQLVSEKGAAGGYASLDGGGKVPSAQLPALAFTDVSVVDDEAEQLALTAEEGDVAVRTDESKSYVHNGGTAGTMADWTELLSPDAAGLVSSFNGRTGAVSPDVSDYSAFYQALHANLTALSGLVGAADRGIYFTALETLALFTLSSFGRSLVDDADAAAARTTLGLAALAVLATVGTAQIDNDAVTYAKMQNVSATDKVLGRATAGAGDVEEIACTAAGRALIDDATAADQRTTLGLGTIATQALGNPLTVNEQTDNYTLVLTDADNKLVDMNKATAVNLTVPPNSDVAFPVGSKVPIRQKGAGQVTVVAGSGVTINTPETLKLKKQYAAAELIKLATNTWMLAGYLEVA